MAEYDELTGLFSLKGYGNAVHQRLNQDSGASYVLIFLDISAFRDYNHKYGFQEGDNLLLCFARELQHVFPDDPVTRITADQFSVFTDKPDISEQIEVLHHFVHTLQKNVSLELKAGIYILRDFEEKSVSLMIDHARLAARSIHDQYDRNIAIYNEDLADREELQRYILNHFDEALDKHYIETWYQPEIRTLTGKICGFEALCRWNDPVRGILSPAVFIPVLEDAHLISRLDMRMLENVCRDMTSFFDQDTVVVPVSINLSRNDFLGIDAFREVHAILQTYHIPPELIHIEITESVLEADPEYLRLQLKHFHDAGYEIWMDDFGSHYSTLNILKDFDFDVLKIDQAFVRNIEGNQKARTLVASVVNMAKHLHTHTLCEGVETSQQIDFLRTIGCEQLQGFYFSKPQPLCEIRKLIPALGLETPQKKRTFNTIGQINLLSNSPMEFERSYDMGSQVPIMLLEVTPEQTQVLYHNPAMDKMAGSLNLRNADGFLQYLMSLPAYKNMIRQSLEVPESAETTHSLDFIISNKFCSISFRTVAAKLESYAYVIFTGLLLDSTSSVVRSMNIHEGIRHLLTVFSRIDLFNLSEETAENLFLNTAQDKLTDFASTDKQALEIYAKKYLEEADRESFLDFYDLHSLKRRVLAKGTNNVSAVFATYDKVGELHTQLYTLIPFRRGSDDMVLSCVHDISNSLYNRVFRDQLLPMNQAGSSSLNDSLIDLLAAFQGIIQINAREDSFSLIYRNWAPVFPERADSFQEVMRDFSRNYVHPGDVKRFQTFTSFAFWKQRMKESGQFHISECFRIRKESHAYTWLDFHLIQDQKNPDIYTLSIQWIRNHTESEMLDFWYSSGQEALTQSDPLTGLLNRRGIDSRIKRYMVRHPSTPGVLIALTIDNFRIVNDILGRSFGDQILKEVASTLRVAFPEDDIIGRNGADAFLVFMKDTSLADAEHIVGRLVSRPMSMDFHGSSCSFTMLAGMAVYPHDGRKTGSLCRKASAALRAAKSGTAPNYRIYDAALCTENRLLLSRDLKRLDGDLPKAILAYRTGADLQILYASNDLVRLCGCRDLQEFTDYSKSSYFQILKPEDRERLKTVLQEYIDAAQDLDDDSADQNDAPVFHESFRILAKDGQVHPVENECRFVQSIFYGDLYYVFLEEAGLDSGNT